jgi:hypothetical protein
MTAAAHTRCRPQGSEAREIYLGKLFGYGAIARALREAAASDALRASDIAHLAQEVCVLARMKGALAGRLPHIHRARV